MLETLKKNAKKSHLTHALISIIVIIAMLVITKFSIFDVLTGPTEVDITADPSIYEGKYVTLEGEYFLNDYVEHTTTTTKKYGGSTTSINGYSYLAFQSIYDYETNTSTWYFYSTYMNRKQADFMYGKMEEAWDYWEDETGTVAPPETVTLTGTWTKMDDQMERYYNQTLSELGIEESEYDKFYYYNLDTSKIGKLNIPLFWTLMVIALLSLLWALSAIIGFFGNGHLKSINQYLQKDASVSMAAIEEDFAQAHLVAKKVWIGKKWTIYMMGPNAQILANKNLVWGYYYQRTGRHSVSEMRLYTTERKLFTIGLSENQTMEALQYYAAEQPQMVIGYTAEISKLYNKKFSEFMELKYNPAMREAQANGY